MDTPAAEPSSYGTFDTLCGLVAGSAVIMLAVGACLLLGALVTYANVDQPGTTDIAKLESKALAASLVSYGVTCFTSGIPLLIFSYGGWIFLDLARNNRLQVQKTDEVLKHLAEINPKYEERLRREQEAAQRRAEAEQEATQRKAEKERQEALARWTAERKQLDRKRSAEEERQKSLAAEAARKQENERQQRIREARSDAQREFDQILAKARKAYRLSDPARIEQLTDEICADIDKLFARLADIDQRFTIKLTKEIGDQFAQHQSFKSLNINLEPA